ncbi:MAG TPA: sulfatase-like hydrolase/transferase [Polyangiaceae bacterium]|nr:sulfatase-like hydrolase/transferase [Polyangiaceae bacterium]
MTEERPPEAKAADARRPNGAAFQKRKAAAIGRKLSVLAFLSLPLLSVLVMDLSRRGARVFSFSGFYLATYLGAIVESYVLWGTLLYAASRRRGATRHVSAALFVLALTLSVGGQRYFHDQYNAYLNVDVSVFASNLMDSVINQLFADIRNYLIAKIPPLLVALGAVWAARKFVKPKRTRALVASGFAPVVLVGSFFVPTQHRHIQAATPDVLYMEAVGGLIRTQFGYTDQSKQLRPRVRNSLPVTLSKAQEAGKTRPNILFVILESVRSDAVCIEPGGCKRTPFSDAVVPNRYPLTQMRSLDSCTAISLAVLWSGVGPNESRDTLHSWPLIFDYAKAAGYDTAFYTSQNMMFGNARLWVKNLGVSQFVSATDLDPTADLDMGAPEKYLAPYVAEHVHTLKEPFLAVVQLSNMHFPYYVNPDGPNPFTPWTTSKAAEDNPAFFNYYQNGVYQEDRHVATILKSIRESALSDHTVILYTSDHGEAFREHYQMGHTFTVLDEEIHVPAWIDAPKGLLGEEQERNLAAARTQYRFHPDLPATILDLMNVWDDPGISKYREKMIGSSLLREHGAPRAMPLTNCAGVWSCAFENWGFMRDHMKIEARDWDSEWHCFDVASDPHELHNLGVPACGDLHGLALSTFNRIPIRVAKEQPE